MSEIGYNSIRVTLVLNHDYPKSSYGVLIKLILDEARLIRDQGYGGKLIDSFLKEKIPKLIKETRPLNQLRFSNEFKLRHLKWEWLKQPLIGVFGLDRGGKTSILESLTLGEIRKQYLPTFGHNRFPMTGLLGVEWNPLFLEVGGKPEFRTLWPDYTDLNGLIFVIDSSDELRFSEMKTEFTNLINLKSNQDIPIAILCNKQDLSESLPVKKIASMLELKIEIDERIILPISAKTGEGIPKAFYWLLESVYNSIQIKQSLPPKL